MANQDKPAEMVLGGIKYTLPPMPMRLPRVGMGQVPRVRSSIPMYYTDPEGPYMQIEQSYEALKIVDGVIAASGVPRAFPANHMHGHKLSEIEIIARFGAQYNPKPLDGDAAPKPPARRTRKKV
jgi:hypothetical protein